MNYLEYKNLFHQILNDANPTVPYDNEEYQNYVKLNESRIKRWDKTMKIQADFVELLQNNKVKQHWIIITEPWCGDAAHIVPFLVKIAELGNNISYEIQLRDSKPFLIESYLTNGGKAIPKLISKGINNEDLFVWGPRPMDAQNLMLELKDKSMEIDEVKKELQNWYNQDKGNKTQNEIKKLILSIQ